MAKSSRPGGCLAAARGLAETERLEAMRSARQQWVAAPVRNEAAGRSIVDSILGDGAADIEARVGAESAAQRAARPDLVEIWCDGLCEPVNPGGIATYGFLARRGGELVVSESGEVCRGPGATNNVAEYAAVSRALEWVLRDAPAGVGVVVRTDSALVVNQLNGDYAVRSERIVALYRRAKRLLGEARRSRAVAVSWVPREANVGADRLTRLAYAAADEAGQAARAARALGLLVERNGGTGRHRVRSSSGRRMYDVDTAKGTCSCPDHQRRAVDRKHLIAARADGAGRDSSLHGVTGPGDAAPDDPSG